MFRFPSNRRGTARHRDLAKGVNQAQRESLSILEEIIVRGQRLEVEPIVWVLGFGGVTGEIQAFGEDDRSSAEATFTEWVRVIGADVDSPQPSADGRRGRQARRVYQTAHGPMCVLVRLTLPATATGN